MDYKATLHMPKTAFEMRGNLAKKEPGIQEKWKDMNLYHEMRAARQSAKPFVLHDGPPYANGDIHLGHAMDKILKDVINRSHFMQGYDIPYVPGWDTHGLPIETAVTKLGHDRKKLGIAKFREICRQYALEQIERQKKGFLSLGSVGDYDHPYVTLDQAFEARQIEVFAKMAQKGLIYQGLKPVYWSPSSETALAEAEVEYQNVTSPTVFVKMGVKDGKGLLSDQDAFVIWTTTPWTLPANQGICLNPTMTYVLVQTEKGNLVMLESLVDSLCAKWNLKEHKVLKSFKGQELEGVTAYHPLDSDKESLVMLADYVTADAGTGCVHTAPAFGADDFNTGHKYGLPVNCNVDEQGRMMASAGAWLEGQYVLDANETIIERLKQDNTLLLHEPIEHSYPHDWRTKKPIIFRATTQWFASIDKIKDELLEQIEQISWVPKWGQQRMHNMIADRDDWCISRQRAWGVPIPIIYGEDGTPLMDEAIFSHVADLVREHGSNVWFERSAKELLPEGYTSEHSPNGQFTKETDTMDVWFDSGSSHTGAMLEKGLPYPADLYFEGFDQYRGWFNSSLIVGTAVYGQSPYKQCLSHGFVMDEKGVKLSKSAWNALAPDKITKVYGADVLRLWACSVDYQQDVSIGQDILKQVSENYRKVRNTLRFLVANLDQQQFGQKQLVDVKALENRYILERLEQVNELVQKAYPEYRFADVVTTLSTFMTNDLSSYYLDYTKDSLYCDAIDDEGRREIQTVLFTCAKVLCKLWAPILVHTMEELNQLMNFEEKSIHLASFEALATPDTALIEQFSKVLEVRKRVLKALEQARSENLIGKSLEARVGLTKEDLESLALVQDAAKWLIVSEVFEADELKVEKAKGHACPRCWNYTTEQDLCPRCQEVMAHVDHQD